ncbi:hypothetical protein GLYMA_02G207251v4 [Glycine max]|nr:hypothetical protein GLYMA_02G207251v4 [Glycine max]
MIEALANLSQNSNSVLYSIIDTGSDVPWVCCSSCNGCPQTSGLKIQLNFLDPINIFIKSIVLTKGAIIEYTIIRCQLFRSEQPVFLHYPVCMKMVVGHYSLGYI